MEQILVTAGFIQVNDKILIAQRLPRGLEGGKWEFPGGKVEPGEDPRAGLQRELSEELGIEVNVGQILDVISVNQADRQLVLLYFNCQIVQGDPKPLECQAVRWLNPEEITLLEMPESDRFFWERWMVTSLTATDPV